LKTFYEFVKTYKDHTKATDQAKLAVWICATDDFPKFSTDFHEISDFLEIYSPFPNALQVFDLLWEEYKENTMDF